MQYSVFICQIEDHAELAKTTVETEAIIDPAADSPIVFGQCCTRCEPHLSLGQEDAWPTTL
ncbi:MAG: CRISPR-associated endonuclease Cas2 [Bifidobacteriaceae bacterium]|nr:CRISPR-associated endonuclease Cas2 [Bifidobacteriaceae bacterium]